MGAYEFQTFDVFTDRKFAGNQLAVIMDAQGLSEAQMLEITREFNYAESTFVFPAEDAGNTARVRIFTPGYEMPFAGHPTVGTAIAIAKARGISDEVRLELNAGLFPVKLNLSGGAAFAEFLNPNLPKEAGPGPDAAAIEKAFSLPEGSLDRDGHKPRAMNAGVTFIYAKAPLAALRAAKLNHAAAESLTPEGVVGVLLYAEGGDAPDADYHVRMFAPGAGVPEDAATGSAAAALPGQIALSQSLADGAHRWVIEQGVEMGRPSRILVTSDIKGGAVSAVRVGGNAVHMQIGQLFV